MIPYPGPNHYFISLLFFLAYSCAPHWIILGTLLLCSWCGDRLAGTTFISLVWLHEIRQNIIDGCEPLPTIGAMLADLPPQEENISESSPATAPTNAVTSSSNLVLAARPTVAQKEPQNHALHEQAVGSTVGIGTSRKPTRLDSPSSAAPLHGKRGRSLSRKDKDKKSK